MTDNESLVIEFDIVTTTKYKIEVPPGLSQTVLSDVAEQAAKHQDFDRVRSTSASLLKQWLLRQGIEQYRNLLHGGVVTPPSEQEVVIKTLGAYSGEAVL